MNIPMTQLHEPRPNTAAEEEYGWLKEISILVKVHIADLANGYHVDDTPDHIENAIRKLEDAADDIRRRMAELDEGTT